MRNYKAVVITILAIVITILAIVITPLLRLQLRLCYVNFFCTLPYVLLHYYTYVTVCSYLVEQKREVDMM